MVALQYVDHRVDPDAWAKRLGISREAIEIYLASEVIDLHVDSFIWHRIFGYDLTKRHGHGLFGGNFMSQVDLPRLREAAVAGAIWSITTNPLRGAKGRADAFARNIVELRRVLATVPDDVAVVRNHAEYTSARALGKHAAFVGIQGGNALDRDLDALDLIPDDVVLRVTLVHLSTSRIGVTSSPLAGDPDNGLSSHGKDYVRKLDSKKIFVDLAHINRRGFFDALEVHDRSVPPIVTHTGISGVYKHWRNLDDEQIRAIADRGGTIGIMYQSSFLGPEMFYGPGERVVAHMQHVIDVAGDDFLSLGSDWDGMIMPPRDLLTCLELPRLVQYMLDRKWSPDRIGKILGQNFLRTVKALRG